MPGDGSWDNLLKRRRRARGSSSFDPEGSGYDYETAKKSGLAPKKSGGHWPSRDPRTGQMLKGRNHKTWDMGKEADEKMGYKLYKSKGGKYYSHNPGQINTGTKKKK